MRPLPVPDHGLCHCGLMCVIRRCGAKDGAAAFINAMTAAPPPALKVALKVHSVVALPEGEPQRAWQVHVVHIAYRGLCGLPPELRSARQVRTRVAVERRFR